MSEKPVADNCYACGEEYLKSELSKVKLSVFGAELNLCQKCANSSTLENYRDVIKLLSGKN